MSYYFEVYKCEIGRIIIEADDIGITALRVYTQDRQASLERAMYALPAPNEATSSARAWLDMYFAQEIPNFLPPLHMIGSPFQIEVWNLMIEIPYGKTATYGDIARAIASRRGIPKMSAQAVGGAAKRNAIPIIIPCHRVVAAGGAPGGYGLGLDLKFRLLEIENRE